MDSKMRIKCSDFVLKSIISLPSAKIGGMVGIFLLFINLLVMDQYVFGAALGLSYII